MHPDHDTGGSDALPLSGRIGRGPSELLREEVLDPQFRYEADHLLPHYIAIEQALVAEYLRMGLVTAEQAADLHGLLGSATREELLAGREASMSDIAFSLERHVEAGLAEPVAAWHVDRSRNDLQSCAQLMAGRARLIDAAGTLLAFGRAAHRLASRYADAPMPGYTHLQAAQIISPGFYLAALSEQVLHTARRLLSTYDAIDACPLGAGAMAGQELPWDRDRLAALLGFGRVQPLALTSVAYRGWALEITAEFGVFGVALSRFTTDLMAWGSSAYGYLDLPDELSGISSAMPQKKNFPVLERIRGRSAHLSSCHLDAVLGQRNTAFSNSVEVSKEAGSQLSVSFDTFESVLRLATAVLDHVRFDTRRMTEACEKEFLGGFTLANALTLKEGVPWRRAQVIAGRYVVAATEAGLTPAQTDPALLKRAAAALGFELTAPEDVLAGVFDVRRALHAPRSEGSARPEAVEAVLRAQDKEFERLGAAWATHDRTTRGAEGGAGVSAGVHTGA
ncbi:MULTISPECIES: argininosuccinate lyase [unclassified Streptomyces]|uniref:argininosuccinate lyase n=1 Tax=unclassified Streptomyces TaxID=2593676 RepID=UPI003661A5F4